MAQIFNPRQFDYKERSRSMLDFLIKNNKTFEIKEKRKIRTNQQNRYLHLCFTQIQLDTGYSFNEVKQLLFKRIVNPEIFIVQRSLGEYLRSTADLDTLEMTKAIDKFRDYCISEMNIYIPAPNELEQIQAWEAELSRYL